MYRYWSILNFICTMNINIDINIYIICNQLTSEPQCDRISNGSFHLEVQTTIFARSERKRFYRHFWSEASMMIGATGWLRQTNKQTHNEPTCCVRGKRRSMRETNRYVYIYIGHESSVGVRFRGEMTPRRVAPC